MKAMREAKRKEMMVSRLRCDSGVGLLPYPCKYSRHGTRAGPRDQAASSRKPVITQPLLTDWTRSLHVHGTRRVAHSAGFRFPAEAEVFDGESTSPRKPKA